MPGPGIVGIWHESWGNGRLDEVLVTGPGGTTAVDPHAKLSTTWGDVKSSY